MLQESWRIQLLGALQAAQANQVITRFYTHKIGGLFAYLAFHVHRTHPREELTELFWPDAEPEAGRMSLRTALASLRRQLEPPDVEPGSVLIADRYFVRLSPEYITTDVAEFEKAVAAANRTASSSERRSLLLHAVSLYQGDLLPGYYEDWVVTERYRLAETFTGALRQLYLALAGEGELTEALSFARRAVQTAPLDEEIHADLIRLYSASGQPSAAQRQYQELERLLREELNATPAQSLPALLQSKPFPESQHGEAIPLPQAEEPAPVSRKEQVVIEIEAPPTLPRAHPTSPPLPVPFTSFYGREEEIARVLTLLAMPEVRIVTLTGLGGSGKTRLALEAARQIRDAETYSVYYVSLVDVTDPRRLGEVIRNGLRLEAGGNREPLEQVVEFFNSLSQESGTAQPLLVLDNFEQLLPAGTGAVQELLERSPALTCLITSRLPLQIPGEWESPVRPLPTPSAPSSPERLLAFASVRLFVSRAQAVRPDFQITSANAQAITQLCHTLEGIPLALELAATRAQVLTPAQMVNYLVDRFGFLVGRQRDVNHRHHTLRAVLDWSYQALSKRCQNLFADLSVFRGGWSPEAAEAICRTSSAEPGRDAALNADFLEALMELRQTSLVLTEEQDAEMRFRMLETVREYAAERLQESGEREVAQRRHRDYFLQRIEEAREHLYGAEQAAWAERLDREFENLRVAVEFCQNTVDGGEAGLRLVGAMLRFCYIRGYYAECWEMCRTMLAHPSAQTRTKARAQVLIGGSVMADFMGHTTVTRALAEEALEIHRELGDKRDIADSLNNLGVMARDKGCYTEARELLMESLTLRREFENASAIGLTLAHLSIAVYRQGDYVTARSLLEESLAIGRQSANRGPITFYLDNLGMVASALGEYEKARRLHEEALALSRELKDNTAIISALLCMGAVTGKLGDYEVARACIEESLSLSRRQGHLQAEAEAYHISGDLMRRQKEMAAACAHHQKALTITRKLGNPLHTICAIEGIAQVMNASGQSESAVRLWGAADRFRESLGAPLPPDELAEYNRSVDAARVASGAAAFEAAWAAGRALNNEQAADFALASSVQES